jgi:NAD(P) transhydrogenase
MAWVGKTERRLRAENRTYLVGHGEFSQIAKGEMLGDETGMLKLLVDPQSRQVLGAHAIGTDAAELIHVAHVLMQLGGTLEHLIAWVFNYPTLAESYKLAAYDIQSQLPSFRFDP